MCEQFSWQFQNRPDCLLLVTFFLRGLRQQLRKTNIYKAAVNTTASKTNTEKCWTKYKQSGTIWKIRVMGAGEALDCNGFPHVLSIDSHQ